MEQFWLELRMCVWDGTYMAPEAEREAMDQIPGWNDDLVLPGPGRVLPRGKESSQPIRQTAIRRIAA